MKRESKQKGKHAGYRRATDDERLLAALRVESGIPIETVAVEFNLSVETGVKPWLKQQKERSIWFEQTDEPTQEEIERAPLDLYADEIAAGYVFRHDNVNETAWQRGRWRARYRVERGPSWSTAAVTAAAFALARRCFVAALADVRSMVAPSKATVAAIQRVYRCLDDDAQALYAPVWDLCQMALDEIEAGREKLQRASRIASECLQPEARAA